MLPDSKSRDPPHVIPLTCCTTVTLSYVNLGNDLPSIPPHYFFFFFSISSPYLNDSRWIDHPVLGLYPDHGRRSGECAKDGHGWPTANMRQGYDRLDLGNLHPWSIHFLNQPFTRLARAPRLLHLLQPVRPTDPIITMQFASPKAIARLCRPWQSFELQLGNKCGSWPTYH